MFFQGLFKAHANDLQHTHVIALGWKTLTPTTAGATTVTCLLLLSSFPPFQSSSPSHCTYTYSESPFPQPNITVDKTNPNPKPQALHSYQLAGCTKEVLSKHNISEPWFTLCRKILRTLTIHWLVCQLKKWQWSHSSYFFFFIICHNIFVLDRIKKCPLKKLYFRRSTFDFMLFGDCTGQ